MSFNIYYGRGEDFSQQELINSFDTIELAEKFLFGYINKKHPNSGYVITNIVSDTKRQYDHGHYTKYYSIVLENKKRK